MKFVYEYRTSDNVRHSGVVVASGREAAFQTLKAQGIRPGKLTEAPGFFNKLFGRGKRWLVIGALGGLLLASLSVIRANRVTIREIGSPVGYADAGGFARAIERRQIWGDSSVIEPAAKNNWRVIFPNPAERLFALFAEPGATFEVMPRLPANLSADMDRALSERLRIVPGELDEYQQMKCIVEGMKEEFRAYRAAGGNLDGYIRRMLARQKEEAEYLKAAQAELQRLSDIGADVDKAWRDLNLRMREQGLPALKMPE